MSTKKVSKIRSKLWCEGNKAGAPFTSSLLFISIQTHDYLTIFYRFFWDTKPNSMKKEMKEYKGRSKENRNPTVTIKKTSRPIT